MLPRLVSIKQKALDFTVGDWYQAGCPNRGVNTVLHNEAPDEPMLGLASDSPPQILLVCKESYGVVSNIYSRAFAMTGSLPTTFFDFHRDTLYLRYETMTHKSRRSGHLFLDVLRCLKHIVDKNCLGKVENLALLVDNTLEMGYVDSRIPGTKMTKWVGNVLQAFGGVKHLTIVHDHYFKASKTQSPACLIEPINNETTTAERQANGRGYGGGTSRRFDEVTQDSLELHQAAKRQSDYNRRGIPTKGWSIPTIKYKAVVAEDFKEYIEAAVKDYSEAS